ncbi:peptidoglycan hydrolase [Kurthia sp. 3B1D]|uniref:Peptidoglycan hydrolase n=1 Tax=Candidatus Kurthia intestinigallinarum TaxID=1562256 RepID=A0A433RTH5_9BACL|nr:DsbA family oxidoreductase [Kurthia sp. 3B1D]RUS55461.1 peptidoglycan hydrolase [Kurthia sp. 3B1D]
MKIEFYADFTCPFSYMGKRRLDEVIEASDEPIEFELKAFQLTPEAPTENTMRTVDLLAKKFGKTPAETMATTARLRDQAAQEYGLEYNYDTMLAPNTKNAHRLAKWSAQFGKAQDMTERFFAAIFTRGLDLNKESDLLQIVEEAGLDVAAAKEVLHSDAYAQEVDADRQEAAQNGIHSVPSYVFDNKLVTGAQPLSVFLQAIKA